MTLQGGEEFFETPRALVDALQASQRFYVVRTISKHAFVQFAGALRIGQRLVVQLRQAVARTRAFAAATVGDLAFEEARVSRGIAASDVDVLDGIRGGAV